MKKRSGSAFSKKIAVVWVRLPKAVVKARAGLMPSEEIDASPPPEGLTVAGLIRWYRGLPIQCTWGEARSRMDHPGSERAISYAKPPLRKRAKLS